MASINDAISFHLAERMLVARLPEAVNTFLQIFTDAVKKRIPTGVKAALALSGGVDSTSVAAVAARLCNLPLPTCSLRIVSDGLDDSQLSRYAAASLGLENHQIPITGETACELLPRSIWHIESPFWFGAVSCPFFEMTRVGQSLGYKVAMTGSGSDELMAGYDFYRVMKFGSAMAGWKLRWLQPTMWRRAIRWIGGPAGIDVHIREVNARLDWYRRHYGEAPPWIYLWSAVDKIAKPVLDSCTLPPSVLPAPPAHDQLRRQLHFEFAARVPNWILVTTNRLGMANGIEVCTPFLDRDLIDFCTELSPDMLVRRGENKYILRRALRGVVPKNITRRRKRSFLTPIASWYLSGSGRELCGDYLSPEMVRRVGLFNPAQTEAVWRKAIQPDRSWETMLCEWVCLMVLSTHILLEQFSGPNFLPRSP